MLKQRTRAAVGILVLGDVTASCLAWLAAYFLRFEFDPLLSLLPATKGVPGLARYLWLLPLIAVAWPVVLSFHDLYRIKRSRSRIDEFFAILSSVIVGTALLLGLTLYVRVYYLYQPDVAPRWEFSQAVFALFVLVDTVALAAGRSLLRRYFQSRWAGGDGAERMVIAGAGPMGRAVAEAILAHSELGYVIVGFLDDHETGPVLGRPVLGPLSRAREITADCSVDELFITLPAQEHAAMLDLIRSIRNECVDIRVVPDLLQYASIKATLEDLDGLPVISLTDVPLLGWNSLLKRLMDIATASVLLVGLLPLFAAIAVLIKLKGGRGPVFFRQERMSLDGKTFQMYKFRSMREDAERETGPVFATAEDPRRTPIGAWLRRRNLDELPQLINVLLGHMSLVGPRPERPPFVQRFRETIPQYMLRHRVKSGITGWAQVNGWRGNTPIEKRIEFDLYYIENWSFFLDVKILILTLFRGFGQRHAY